MRPGSGAFGAATDRVDLSRRSDGGVREDDAMVAAGRVTLTEVSVARERFGAYGFIHPASRQKTLRGRTLDTADVHQTDADGR